MNANMPVPRIRNSDIKGFKVLVVDPDKKRAAKHEARMELDADLQRVDVFFVNSLNDARDLIKSRRPNVTIFPGELDGQDFVSLQLEFRNANASTGLVPLVGMPTLQQYRESRRIGGVIDFEDPHVLEAYESLRDLIVQLCRSLAAEVPGFEDGLNYSLNIQRALIVRHPNLETQKHESSILCREMSAWYDLSSDEAVKLILAEKLFLPDLTRSDYETLLAEDPYGILDVLSQSASWTQPGAKPTSTMGLILTLSNYIAHLRQEQKSSTEITSTIVSRPHHLLHVSLRVVTPDRVVSILTQLDEEMSIKATG